MKRVAIAAVPLISAILSLAACGSSKPEGDRAPAAPIVTAQTSAPAPATRPAPTYSPHFDEREGDTYFYATAVSEDEEKQGKRIGDVVSFRYSGQQDGRHTLISVDDVGRQLASYQCATPCKIIKRTLGGEVERMPYDPRSVIGAAFEDALNGSLTVASRSDSGTARRAQSDSTIPAPFIGEWNEDLKACGTGNNDSRLRIEPRRVRFYESDGDVQRVNVINRRSVEVTASFAGEGQTWTDKVTFVLSRSGDDLSSGDVSRHRCPA